MLGKYRNQKGKAGTSRGAHMRTVAVWICSLPNPCWSLIPIVMVLKMRPLGKWLSLEGKAPMNASVLHKRMEAASSHPVGLSSFASCEEDALFPFGSHSSLVSSWKQREALNKTLDSPDPSQTNVFWSLKVTLIVIFCYQPKWTKTNSKMLSSESVHQICPNVQHAKKKSKSVFLTFDQDLPITENLRGVSTC